MKNDLNFELEKREKKPLTAKEIKLLDEFAGQQAAILTQMYYQLSGEKLLAQAKTWVEEHGGISLRDCIAKDSYKMAQALLKERKNHL